MTGKRRAVLIFHPDFDQPGADGIKEAKEFAEQLIQGQDEMISMAEKSGENPAIINNIRDHTQAFHILIRNIPEDIIK